MVTVNDVMHHISQDLQTYNGPNGPSKDKVTSDVVSIKLALTTDLEATEADFLEKFGHGRTFYFKVNGYEHGKQLAADVFKLFKGEEADVTSHTGELFANDDLLYLFIHLRFVRLQGVSNEA
jgi:hypothetical protein